ncbi:ATP-binding protein [Streptomyces chartreusis]|uniref:ATP-binding protein n=1 Tax=Streptomyces chartreusis TaxID=1969 RepID=UPI00368DF939
MSCSTSALDKRAAEVSPSSAPAQRAVTVMLGCERCVGTTRHFTAAVLARWGVIGEEPDAAVLIVSELATNAVQHGRSDLTVALTLAGDTLRIDVTDHGEPVPRPAPLAAAADEHGRGLDIVSCLADWTEICQGDWGRRVSATVGIAD